MVFSASQFQGLFSHQHLHCFVVSIVHFEKINFHWVAVRLSLKAKILRVFRHAAL